MGVTDFVPSGVQHQTVQVAPVQAAPVQVMQGPVQPLQVDINNNDAFPTLSSTPQIIRVVNNTWRPGASIASTQPVLATSMNPIRTSAELGPNQPRNTFIKTPKTASREGSTAVGSIDWSVSGIPPQVTTDITSVHAHLTPNQVLSCSNKTIPLSVLRAETPKAQFAPPAKITPSANRPIVIQQPQGRR